MTLRESDETLNDSRSPMRGFALALLSFIAVILAIAVVDEIRTRRTSNESFARGCVVQSAHAGDAPPLEEDSGEDTGRTPPPPVDVGEVLILEVSGYTSTEDQTDSDPCIAADLTDICRRKARGEPICASNRFPLGTQINVEGLGTCVVRDRMNRRYNDHVDWYFGQDEEKSTLRKDRARKIGRKDRTVRVLSLP